MTGIIPESLPAMTVPSEQSRIQYTTDGTSVSFPVPFRFLNAAHLQVARQRNDESSILELGVDYSVSGVGNQAGGTITTTSALPAGDSISIERVVPITQETAYQRNDPFPERAHEQALDKLTMICQMLGGVLGLTPGSANRALLLGAADTDGKGSYRANGNRISNLGAPKSTTDAARLQDIVERLSDLAADGSGQFVVERLADTSAPENGAGMIGFSPDLEYDDDSSGFYLSKALRWIDDNSQKLQSVIDKSSRFIFLSQYESLQDAVHAAIGNTLVIDCDEVLTEPVTKKLLPNESITIVGYGGEITYDFDIVDSVERGAVEFFGDKQSSTISLDNFKVRRISSPEIRNVLSNILIREFRDVYVSRVRSSLSSNAGLSVIDCSNFFERFGFYSGSIYAGLRVIGSEYIDVEGSIFRDHGRSRYFVTVGYGFTCGEKLASTGNTVRASVKNCISLNNRRKGIDFHDCRHVEALYNYVNGYGYTGIYAYSESQSKTVQEVRLVGNTVANNQEFYNSVTHSASFLSVFGIRIGVDFQQTSFNLDGNTILGGNVTNPGFDVQNAPIVISCAAGAEILDIKIGRTKVHNSSKGRCIQLVADGPVRNCSVVDNSLSEYTNSIAAAFYFTSNATNGLFRFDKNHIRTSEPVPLIMRDGSSTTNPGYILASGNGYSGPEPVSGYFRNLNGAVIAKDNVNYLTSQKIPDIN